MRVDDRLFGKYNAEAIKTISLRRTEQAMEMFDRLTIE